MTGIAELNMPRGITGLDRDSAERGVLVGIPYVTTNNPITAAAAGTQAAAVPLVAGQNVITGGGANSSVVLPAQTEPGANICVVNLDTSAKLVFASGNDTINGFLAGASVSTMPDSIVYFTCIAYNQTTGVATWVATGLGIGFSTAGNGSFVTYSSIDGLIPTVGGNQGNAVLATASAAGYTPASVGGTDAGRLPPAVQGMEIAIINKSAANAMIMFPASNAQGGVVGGDAINNQAVNTSISVPAASVLIFFCLTTGTWWTK